MQRNRPFQALRDPQIQQQFDDALMGYLTRTDFRVITVVIDKLEHLNELSPNFGDGLRVRRRRFGIARTPGWRRLRSRR